MIARTSLAVIVLAGLCFGGSFLGTVMLRSEEPASAQPDTTSPVANCLSFSPEQAKLIEGRDPEFPDEFRTLLGKLETARVALAETFEDATVADEEIRRRVEAVITAHNQLERRVAEYLITVRDQLTPDQQRRLFGLCANRVRDCCKRWGGKCRAQDGAAPCGMGQPGCKPGCSKHKPCGGK